MAFTGFQAQKKRRPWTSLDDEVVGRGNLNRLYKLLILNEYIGFVFILECHLECQQSLLGTVERVDGALLPYHSSTTC